MDGGKSPGTGSLLCLAGAGTVGSLGARQDTARSKDEDMAIRELLLELAGETEISC